MMSLPLKLDQIEAATVPFRPKWAGSGPRVTTGADFVADYVPPEFLIEDTLQRRYLYALTAQTGHGKTATAIEMALCVASGRPLGSRGVEQGAVLYMIGENADDVRGRLKVAAALREINLAGLPIYFVEGPFDLMGTFAAVREQVDMIGGVSLVIVDTAAAFFQGEDDNSNVQMGAYARDYLRPLTKLPGGPAVLVPAHPIKSASRDNLVPRGGGAFLNEIDGNLRLWSSGDGVTELHWSGKLRGPGFEPLHFALDPVKHACLVDSKGRMIPTILARALTDQETERKFGEQRNEEDEVLDAMRELPDGSLAEWCQFLGWLRASGEPQKSKITRRLANLERDRLVRNQRGRWALTDGGKQEAAKASSPYKRRPK